MTSAAPSFKGLRPASESAARAKRANRKRDTAAELALRRAVWRMGLRYRVNVATMPGTPDIVFSRARVAVFCDGDFWHGRDWPRLRAKLECGTNPGYWSAKIARNRERDRRVDAELTRAGWRVVRLWETDIRRDPDTAARLVAGLARERRESDALH
jgi:DNA mismatch endonuclease (patch repair protein)